MDKSLLIESGYLRYLDAEGRVVQPLPDFAGNRETLIELYRAMVVTRSFDAKAISLQRTGRLGTYPSTLGQEAVGVAIGHAMIEDDVFAGTYREHAVQLLRGVTMLEMLLFWGGDESGLNYAVPVRDFPPSIPIATHAPHAAGAALAMKLRGEKSASVCVFGDGASSKGDTYEAMNLAGVWNLPVLFIIINNQWAISVPRSAQSAAPTLAQKAVGCGFEGVQVDGNDVIAVRDVVGRALERMRDGGGPHLIEAMTYRMNDHTTADDASRYRPENEVSDYWKEDPVVRMRAYLTEAHQWSRDDEEALIAECSDQVDAAAKEYLAAPLQAPESIFDHLYADLPEEFKDQRDAVIKKGENNG